MKTKTIDKTDISRYHGDKELNSKGKMCGMYMLDDGYRCKYCLNRQSPAARYKVRGRVTLRTAKGTVLKAKRRKNAENPADKTTKENEAKREINMQDDDPAMLRMKIADAAISLHNEHCLNLHDESKKLVPVSEMTFSMSVKLFSEQYIERRSKSEGRRKTCLQRLKRVAKLIDGKNGSISQRKVRTACEEIGSQWRDYIKEAEKFLTFAYQLKRDSNGKNAFSEYLTNNPTKAKENRARLRRKAANTDILSLNEERRLNGLIIDGIKNGLLIGVTLVKEGGLPSREVCGLKWSDVLFVDNHGSKAVFIRYHLPLISGATHDYTFPLFPFGAEILRLRWDWLLKQGYSEDQIREMYIASKEKTPEVPLDPKELTEACRNLLHSAGVDYATLVGMRELQTGAGINMLLSTYRYRLKDVCGLKNDPAAAWFMEHNSLANMLQANYYRSFTDETGRSYLLGALSRDQRLKQQTSGGRKLAGKQIKPKKRVAIAAGDPQSTNQVVLNYRPKAKGQIRIFTDRGGCCVVVQAKKRLPDDK